MCKSADEYQAEIVWLMGRADSFRQDAAAASVAKRDYYLSMAREHELHAIALKAKLAGNDSDMTRPITMSKAANSLGCKAKSKSQYIRRLEKDGKLTVEPTDTRGLFRFNLSAFGPDCQDDLK